MKRVFIYGKVVKGVRIALNSLEEDNNVYIVTVNGKDLEREYKVKGLKTALGLIRKLEVKYLWHIGNIMI